MKFKGKKFISLVLAALMVVSVFVVGTVSASATAWSNSGTSYLYFDFTKVPKTPSTWAKSNSWVLISNGTNVYASKLSGSVAKANLVYRNLGDLLTDSTVTPANIEFVTIVCSNSLTKGYLDSKSNIFDSNNELTDSAKTTYNISNYTNNYTGGISSSSQRYCLYADSSRDLNLAGPYSAYTGLNFSQTVNVIGSGTIKGTYHSFVNSVKDLDTTTNGSISSSFDAARASDVSLSVDEPAEGYHFVGWYSDSECTQFLGNSTTLPSYTVDGARTIYAKFSNAPTFTQTANAGDGGTATVSGGGYSGSSIDIESNTSVTFTALPNANHKFDGWYDNEDFLGDPVSTSDPYIITANSANTLYAKFSEVTISSDEVTLSTKNNGSRASYDNEDNYNTTLSSQAINYYTSEVKNYITSNNTDSNNVYATFEALSVKESNDASSSYTVAQNNSLYTALYKIMKETHTNSVSYPSYGNSSLAHYWLNTDTSSANYGVGDNREVYTFFYSDVDCYEHINMQREHIWPKSKASYLMKTGLGGSDLHHLRPAYGKVNNIKSNWGFADIRNSNGSIKSGWKKVRTVDVPVSGGSPKTSLWRAIDNKGETFCDYCDDVHGDIARILLYIYTRWQQPNLYTDIVDADGNPDTSKLPDLDPDDTKDTGERIIYDLPTLLQWMEEDPVSEWEMQRNDLTQQVQGNRNVFIDYPELAWLLFDQTVPSGMDTPSGMKNGTGTDLEKGASDSRVYTDEIIMDFASTMGNGKAEIKAYNNSTQSYVANGESVDRGDIITYTIIPDGSTINSVTEFVSDDDTHTGSDYRRVVVSPNTTSTYSFSRAAGYYNGSPNTSYEKERIKVNLSSNVCELNYKVNSTTAYPKYVTGGSGSGMVTARITGTNTILESGDTVPNGTSVTLTITPDYGSKVYGVTRYRAATVNDLNAENNYSYYSEEGGFTFAKIAGTDSYTCTKTLNCSDGSVRSPKFNIYFAQTFNSNDKDEHGIDRHIYNKGLRPDADDPYGEETDFTENFEICGVQVKTDENNSENRALRFISVVDKKILAKAKHYGWVFGYTNKNLDTKTVNRYAYTLVKDGANAYTADCTGTGNTSFGIYGSHDTDTNYKYITAAVNNIQSAGTNVGLGTTIIARPYVELDDKWVGEGAPSVIYGQYVDFDTGEEFCACSGSYNHISGLAG